MTINHFILHSFSGTYTELEGQTECGECKAGMYCPGDGTANSCDKGYFCPVNTSDHTVSDMTSRNVKSRDEYKFLKFFNDQDIQN